MIPWCRLERGPQPLILGKEEAQVRAAGDSVGMYFQYATGPKPESRTVILSIFRRSVEIRRSAGTVTKVP
jgi:hypothetical protein